MTRKQGSKEGIRRFMEANVGQVVTSDQIREAGNNASEWGRRLRELRDEEGYAILSHNDRADLKPGEYILESLKRRPAFARGISKETRALVLERNGYTCQMCGAAAGDPDPYHPSRTIRLTMGHVIDKSKGGDDSLSNLRALCSNCNEGLQNIAPPKPDQIHLLAQIRKAPRDDQLAVLEWLRMKFKDMK